MNTTAKGDRLENKLYEIVKEQIDRDDFSFGRKSQLTLYQKKSYYSHDRDDNIIFDVVVEMSDPRKKDNQKPHITIIFECKNYSSSVGVNDVEEFFAKTQGVIKDAGMVKPVFVTNARLQSGAFNYLKNKGMGYIALSENQKSNELDWILQRSVYTHQSTKEYQETVLNTLYTGIIPKQYQMCCFGKNYLGYNFHLFLEEMLMENQHDKKPRKISKIKIPFLTIQDLEEKADNIRRNNQKLGMDFLQDLIQQEKERAGLSVRFVNHKNSNILGSISFDKNEIIIYNQENKYRNNFTLAHELSHYYLNHGIFIKKEYVYRHHFDIDNQREELRNIEIQANRLASYLLMPKNQILLDITCISQQLNIKNRGFGMIYLDGQQCNVVNFNIIMQKLTRKYQASNEALKIRLQDLGILVISNNLKKPNDLHAETNHFVDWTKNPIYTMI